MDKNVPVKIKTSKSFGSDFCDHECPHLITYINFPLKVLCKVSGKVIEPDHLKRVQRTDNCKYMCGEEVDDQFWNPLKGGG